MYPNPQDALPLPPDATAEGYEKHAMDLAAACRSDDPEAIGAWTAAWIRTFSTREDDSHARLTREWMAGQGDRVAEYARQRLSAEPPTAPCALADAQFVIARAHGFMTWAGLVQHIEALARPSSPISTFEAAADAIVEGDAATLERLLRHNPELVRARSTREHGATLLHYTSANGVEGYRQKSPGNAGHIARMLLEAGSEVDAEANVYGGGCTTLGLVATSEPPAIAGVQKDVIDALLEHGARMDHTGSTGNKHALIRGCLANGQPEAAAYLVARGAPLDFVGAAGLGHLDVVKTFFDTQGARRAKANTEQTSEAFFMACGYGRTAVVEFLLDRGIAVDREVKGYGAGHTGLHVAAYEAHVDVVHVLLRRGARLDINDKTWGTPPLTWALTGWCDKGSANPERYYDVVAMLVAAGAVVKPEVLEWDKAQADPEMLAALSGRRRVAS